MKLKRGGHHAKPGKAKKSVDAWDTGRSERKRNEQAKRTNSSSSSNAAVENSENSKRLRFDPKPATFQAPTRTEMLTQRMGGFAGPLLGALWIEQEDEEDGIIKSGSSSSKQNSEQVVNAFNALQSSSSGEEEEEEPNPFEVKPAPFATSSNWRFGIQPTTAAPKSADPWALKEPTFKLDAAAGSGSNKPEFEFKPASFHPKEPLILAAPEAATTAATTTKSSMPYVDEDDL